MLVIGKTMHPYKRELANYKKVALCQLIAWSHKASGGGYVSINCHKRKQICQLIDTTEKLSDAFNRQFYEKKHISLQSFADRPGR